MTTRSILPSSEPIGVIAARYLSRIAALQRGEPAASGSEEGDAVPCGFLDDPGDRYAPDKAAE